MMAAAQRHGELVADLAPECAVLHEAQMMGICWPAATNQTWLFGHEPHVIPVTNAARLGIGQMGLIDACRVRTCGSILLPVPRLGGS